MSLSKYQKHHVEKLFKAASKHDCILDASPPGTGKTYTSSFFCKELNLKTIVICPANVLLNWLKVLTLFKVEILGIASYDLIRVNKWYKLKTDLSNSIELSDKGPSKPLEGISDFKLISEPCPYMNENKLHFNIPENTILIFDEVQNCKNKETKNANVLEYTLSHLRKIRKSKQGPAKILILSATLTDKLEKIVYFGKVLGLFNTTEEYYAWISKEIQTNNKKFKDEIERELFIVHNTLFPEYGSRMESINLNLPTNKLFLVGCKWKDPVNKSLLETINLYKHLESKTHGLGAIIRKRQYLELVKVPVFCKMISDNISKKKKLVVLVNFKDTVSFIAQYLKQHNITYCVIEGGQGLKERQEYIDSFQNNEVDVILAIIQAGGVGLSLHDLQGKHPRVSLISITWSGQDTNQCFGRIARMGSKSVTEQYILFVLDSYEEYICKVMEDKLKILSGINNGNVNEFNLKKIRDS